MLSAGRVEPSIVNNLLKRIAGYGYPWLAVFYGGSLLPPFFVWKNFALGGERSKSKNQMVVWKFFSGFFFLSGRRIFWAKVINCFLLFFIFYREFKWERIPLIYSLKKEKINYVGSH